MVVKTVIATPWKPDFVLVANETNITSLVRARLVSIRYTDAVGLDSDILEIVLADDDEQQRLTIPPKGAELTFSIGYGVDIRKVGMFVCDEVEVSGWPEQLTIRARAATYEKSKGGKADLQSQKSRTWEKGTTLGAMATKIAKEHGLKPVIAAKLANIPLPHVDQTDESDLNLLLRLARKYDALVKPSGGSLIVSKKGASTTASGAALPKVQIYREDVTDFRMVRSSRETAGMVVAYYHAVKEAKRHEVKVGKGEPVRRIKQYYPTQEMALAAARADLARRERGMETLSFQTVGGYDLVAEGMVELVDFRDGVSGVWLIKSANHSLDVGGWSVRLECEKPNDGETKDAAIEYSEPEAVA